MKKSLQSLVLLLMALMVPVTATAAYEQLADGVYQDGSTLYITSGVTSLGDLQVNPSEIYCYATIPPACVSNTFTGYDATLHVPAAGMVSYFTTLYWYNFNNILSDAIEPLSVTMNTTEAELEIGQQLSLSATVAPIDATPKTVYWSSSDASVATVSSDGSVTAIAVGECDILATCVDKVAICHVTVVPPRVTITLDKHEAQLLPNHTITLTATCSPIDVDLAVTTSNPAVAIPRIVNGTIMVVGVAEGSATITVNAADGWGHPDACEITVYTEHGDVNCDGYVSISDVTTLIDYLLSSNPDGLSTDNADTNRDGNVSIADVTTLIDSLLSGLWPWDEQPPKVETFSVNGVSFRMVEVKSGTFMMGATAEQSDDAFEDEYPVHQVTLSDFMIGQTEVTQELWLAVMGSNPSNLCDDIKGPVDHVTWNQCQIFVSRLSALTGKHFRLPTEAEWEYAARGGNKSKHFKYSGSNNIDEVAWCGLSYDENPGSVTKVVGSKKANELGLYDMSGNVMEWCLDWYGSYECEPMTNPTGPSEGTYGVFRGGCSIDDASGCRVSRRAYNGRDALGYLGLRVVLVPNEVFTVNGVSFTMVPVDGGTFTMGATYEQGNEASNDEKPAHRVTLSNYCIGETEVTQALWVAVMGNNPSEFTDDLNYPVAKVSWEECQTFLTKLNQITGKSFRFPTEAEWEYAARGGQNTMQYKYAGSDDIDEVAWYNNNSSSQTHPVATKKPNELGLYDMSGNVSEWVQDWESDYSSNAQTNPSGPETGIYKVIRNGGWNSDATCNRVSYRGGGSPTFPYRFVGLRLALDPEICPMPEDHEYVDLGLPSGTLWATCNVGANSPEEYGDYFAWGETETKDLYGWSTYKWCNGSYDTLTKYCTNSDYGFNGFTDGKTELDPEDDAAYVNWGPSWRMPSVEQQNELIDNCTWTWTTKNGVNGRLVIGPNGSTIFLPAAGYQWESFYQVGSKGYYRSRTLASGHFNPYAISFSSGSLAWDNSSRALGFVVRAVRVP